MRQLFTSLVLSLALISMASPSLAGNKRNVPPGNPFQELLTMVEALERRIDGLEEENNDLQTALDNETSARIAGDNNLQAEIDGLEAAEVEDRVAGLEDKLTCVADTSDSADVFFEGCNVHVRNGVGTTDSINGLGNLIVGYDKERVDSSDKTGSHNIVIGDKHNYSNYGGLVAGFKNTVSGQSSSVSGGVSNEASGNLSSISGGTQNTASGIFSSVSGGQDSEASGHAASISGGAGNTASGSNSSVSAGTGNKASGNLASVSGGFQNLAEAGVSSISGGWFNQTIGANSSISGGSLNKAIGTRSSILGGLKQSTSTTDDTIPALP